MIQPGDRVLVTGADGFIGSHLSELLVKSGYRVKAFVQYNSFNTWGWLEHSPQEIKDALEVFSGDVRDPHGVKTAMEGCDAVFHLAALIAIPYSYHSPDTYIDTNIKGTLNILQAARELNLKHVIHTSTSEVYGSAVSVPIDESHPLQPQSPYSASKIGADQIALSFYHAFEMPVTVVRPFNTYGPRQSARAVIPTIITQIANGQTEIQLGALDPTRDFTYVIDTASGFIAAAETDQGIGKATNLGVGFDLSIGQLASTIAQLMNREVIIKEDPQRIRPAGSEVTRLLSDNSKAKERFNWTPSMPDYDGLCKGLLKTIDWFTQDDNLKLYKSDQYNI